MKRLLLIPLSVAAVALVWSALDSKLHEAVTSTVKLTTPLGATAKAKPPCVSPANPNVAAPLDCIPQHVANLPPDPGPAGKLTIDGVDVDKDGIRDDVQRWIVQNWGHSPVAVKALTIYAQIKQIEVHYGDDLGKTETRKRFGPETERMIICYGKLETKAMLAGRASDKLTNVVLNTPERWKRSRDFDYMFAHGVYMLPDITPAEACGFDPTALAARTGEQTIADQLAAELAARAEEEQE
jgi:hypothetical protein